MPTGISIRYIKYEEEDYFTEILHIAMVTYEINIMSVIQMSFHQYLIAQPSS